MASNDEGSPPPVLTIDLDDEDDGFPTTPPLLEREVYIDETVKCEAEPDHEVENHDFVGERNFQTESRFPLPKKMRSFNPMEYYRHSSVFLFDVVCILCQRVCNDTHVVLCGQFHRFCKSCIMTRWDGKSMKCPRCNGNVTEAPQFDTVFDNIIKALRYDRKKINYLHIEESSAEEESASEDSDMEDRRNGTCSGFASGEDSTEEKDVKTTSYYFPPKERWTNTCCPDDNWLIRRYKRRNNQEVRGTTPPYRFPPSSPNSRVIPSEWHIDKRKKPLEGMIYKNFECNSGHSWPPNIPPPLPHGLSVRYFKNIPAIQKIKEKHMNMDYLSKREKKILIHQQIAKLCDPDVIEQFESSSDDDEPPRKFRKMKFEYPDNYRKPRRNWRDEFYADGTRKVKKRPFDVKLFITKLKKKHKWNKDWGNPLLIVRENSSESAFPRSIFRRIYTATGDDTTIAHLRVFLYNKIADSLKLEQEDVLQLYQVDFYAVLKSIPGKKVNIIKCDANVGKVAAAAAQSPSKGSYMHTPIFPFCGPSTSGLNRFNGSPTSMPLNSIHIDGKKVIFPFGRKEPTVREFALKAMSLKDDRVMASKRRMMMAPPFPDNSLRIESGQSQTPQPVQTVVPTVHPHAPSTSQNTNEVRKDLPPLLPLQRIPGPSTQPPQLQRIEPRPIKPKHPEEVVQLVPTVDPETRQISFSQLTHDGKLIKLQQRLLPISPQRLPAGGSQHIIHNVTPPKPPGQTIVSPNIVLPSPRRISQGDSQATVQSPPHAAPQSTTGQSTSPRILQSEQQKATAQGFSLDKPCTVYSTSYPLRPLEETVSCGELRKKMGVHGGARLVLFFSIKDQMPQLNPVVGPSRP